MHRPVGPVCGSRRPANCRSGALLNHRGNARAHHHSRTTQAEIRRQYLKLAKETHPDVSAGDDAAFRRVSWAYEQLSGEREELPGPSTPWQARRPASPGAKAYHRDQQGVAKAMMAMQLAAAGKRADALELLLSASTGKLPGAGEKAALFVFDTCTAHSFSQQPVEHAKVCCLAIHSGGEGGRCARSATRVLTRRLRRRRRWPRFGDGCSSTTPWTRRLARRGSGRAYARCARGTFLRLPDSQQSEQMTQGLRGTCGGTCPLE